MSAYDIDITTDARLLQERDEFRSQGWLKLIAPAKVNLHLAIGARRDDGYHDAVTVMHALNLHDVVYLRRADEPKDGAGAVARLLMTAPADVEVPELALEDNIACKAANALAGLIGRDVPQLDVRIEKNIPAQGGLGGGSTDAAAMLVGAAQLWGLSPQDPALEQAARGLGSDVAFFLRGGCACHGGTGELFVRSLRPSKRAVALVKPTGGVSTAEAYRAFDRNPVPVPDDAAANAAGAHHADDVILFNNLSPASESLMPELADLREWMASQPGTDGALLCGSGATTFAPCDDFATACALVAAARKRGLWARATSFGSARAMAVPSQGAA